MAGKYPKTQMAVMIQRFHRAVVVIAIAFCLCLPSILTRATVAQGVNAAGAQPTNAPTAATSKAKTAADKSFFAVVFSGGVMGIGIMISQGTAGAGDLASGIYSAPVTTVCGLVIAIPSLAAFAIFRNKIDEIISDTAYSAQHVFSSVRRRIPGGTVARPNIVPPPRS